CLPRRRLEVQRRCDAGKLHRIRPTPRKAGQRCERSVGEGEEGQAGGCGQWFFKDPLTTFCRICICDKRLSGEFRVCGDPNVKTLRQADSTEQSLDLAM